MQMHEYDVERECFIACPRWPQQLGCVATRAVLRLLREAVDAGFLEHHP
jgi:hypothetical protein